MEFRDSKALLIFIAKGRGSPVHTFYTAVVHSWRQVRVSLFALRAHVKHTGANLRLVPGRINFSRIWIALFLEGMLSLDKSLEVAFPMSSVAKLGCEQSMALVKTLQSTSLET
jgi:hypothetical protein